MAEDYEEVNVWEYIGVLVRRKWLILMIVAVALVGGAVGSFVKRNFYQGELALYSNSSSSFCFEEFFTNLLPAVVDVEVMPKSGGMAVVILKARGPDKKTVAENLDKIKQELMEKTEQVVGNLVELKLMHPVYVVKDKKWGVNLGIAGVLGLFVGILMAFGYESYTRWESERKKEG